MKDDFRWVLDALWGKANSTLLKLGAFTPKSFK